MLVLVLCVLHIRDDDPSTGQLPLRAKMQRLDFGGHIPANRSSLLPFHCLATRGNQHSLEKSARIIGLFIDWLWSHEHRLWISYNGNSARAR